MNDAGLHRHGLRTARDGFSVQKRGSNAEGIYNLFDNSYTLVVSSIAETLPFWRPRGRACSLPGDRSCLPHATVIASKRILLCRFTTPPARTRPPTCGLICLADCPTFALTGSRNATIRRFSPVLVPSMRASVNEILLTYHLRFPSPFISRRARSGQNVSQMHYARKGIVTPEMEFVALRESMLLERLFAGSCLRIAPAAAPR